MSGGGVSGDASGGGWRVSLLDWEAIGVNPAANDLVYFLTVGLRSADAAQWEEAYRRSIGGPAPTARAEREMPAPSRAERAGTYVVHRMPPVDGCAVTSERGRHPLLAAQRPCPQR